MVELSLEQAFERAEYHVEKGEVAEARKFYQAIITALPNNERAQQALFSLPKIQVSTDTQSPPQEVIYQLASLYDSGQLTSIVEQAQTLTKQYPKAFIIWNILGAAHKDLGDIKKASQAFKKVTKLKPTYADGFNNYGVTLKEQGRLEEAIEGFEKAIFLKPDYDEAYFNMGITLQEKGKLEEAIEAFEKEIFLKPDYVDAYNNMGNALKDQGKLEEAIETYKKAIAIKPDYVDAYNNMGNALNDQGKLEEAIEAFEKAIFLKSDYVDAYYNMGNALKDKGKLEEAIEAYKKAIAIKPDYVEAYNNMGNALKDQSKLEKAIEAYKEAIAIKPDYAEAYNNMGNALKEQGKLEEAIEAYTKALSLKPDYVQARSHRLYLQAKICNWKTVEEDHSSLPKLGISGNAIAPFTLLSLEDAPERHRLRSENYAKEHFPVKSLMKFERPSQMPKRLRIGYFSADFKEHPVAYLIAKVLEQHNCGEFEVFGYSLHGSSSCNLHQRIKKSFDYFTDVKDMSDKEVALRARHDRIDIAIDLNGYTQNARTGIFAYRAAPIQINYLGFPGTMGANFIDYIIADQNLIPPSNQKYYFEKQLYLPNTYMPTDNGRKFSKHSILRNNMGLPDSAFVFCCFNNNYKISPNEFDIWMRLLTKVENSVLWLRKSNQLSDKNIIKEAQKRNIDSSRLVFTDRVSIDDHLSRYKLADLFIDTFAFNAHTTASEALWAGLPVVTKLGKGFAARVAGSLLNAVGLPELITHNEEAYEALILELATKPKKLSAIKKKLEANRLSTPLFNTEQYTKHLENGYLQAYQRHFDGEKPDTIIVHE
ncbi:tetratricopeptide repeat protein [Amylibacter sp.]|nr:tetratricopeptide repeat protein [Amylibacter sp.]